MLTGSLGNVVRKMAKKAAQHPLSADSFCGLSQAAAIPMKSALKHFAEAFEKTEEG